MNRLDSDALVSVVVPVYNERDTLEEILDRIQSVDLRKEIVLVDDGSTDGTRDLLRQLAAASDPDGAGTWTMPTRGGDLQVSNVRVMFQDRNQGKGAAIRRGFAVARGEIVLVQDADLEYDPAEYHRLLAPILEGRADMVYGSRFLGGEPHRVLMFWHTVGNRFLTLLSNMLTNLNLTDVWTCYKVIRRDALQKLELRENRFGIEAEMTAKAARADLRIYEVPISYHGRTYGQGKKITWRDGVKALVQTLRYGLFG